MNPINAIARLFRRRETSAVKPDTSWHRRDRSQRGEPAEPVVWDQPANMGIRRWSSASTNRLNRAHWEYANGERINADLEDRLPNLWARCAYEEANNPFVAGVIRTHQTDIVGPHGPTLQVESDDERYNQEVEDVWREWFSAPTACGQIDGPEMMRGWIRGDWIWGELLSQLVSDPESSTPVKLRVHPLHSDRLWTPPEHVGNFDVALGVQRTRLGRPLIYFISDEQSAGHKSWSYKYVPVNAGNIMHDFQRLEPGQARGVPLLANSLDTIADLRDYDAEVLDAARNAAYMSVLLSYQDTMNDKYSELDVSTPMERRQIRTLPPGWQPHEINGNQPGTTYVEYRTERMREIGRSADMPLMLVRLGSEEHSFSSARFDGQVYQRSVFVRQARCERQLVRLATIVELEARLAGAIRPRPSGRVAFRFTNWHRLPHVDPSKEAKALSEEVASGRRALSDTLNEPIRDLARRIRRDIDVLAESGIDYYQFIWPNHGAHNASPVQVDSEDDQSDESDSDADESASEPEGDSSDA